MVKIVVKVEVVPYNEDWPRKYALEANVIRNIVLDELQLHMLVQLQFLD